MRAKKRAAVCGLGSLLVFLFVWQQLQSVRTGYELERTRKLIASQRERNSYLRMELEQILSPARIERVASDHLKMLPPSPEAVIVLDSLSARRAGAGLIRKLPSAALSVVLLPQAARQAVQSWLPAVR